VRLAAAPNDGARTVPAQGRARVGGGARDARTSARAGCFAMCWRPAGFGLSPGPGAALARPHRLG
jgi:hypothetical protein